MSLILAHRGGEESGLGDNTIASIKESLKRGYDIIELDVRRSSDGILYCYHGNGFEILFDRLLLKNKTFAELKKRKRVSSLKEALDVILNNACIFVDIKDRDIQVEELQAILEKRKLAGLYISSLFPLGHLKQFKRLLDTIPKSHMVYARTPFLSNNLAPLKKAGVTIVQLFSWCITRKRIAKLRHHGFDIAFAPILISKKRYCSKAKEFSPHYVHGDIIKKENGKRGINSANNVQDPSC